MGFPVFDSVVELANILFFAAIAIIVLQFGLFIKDVVVSLIRSALGGFLEKIKVDAKPKGIALIAVAMYYIMLIVAIIFILNLATQPSMPSDPESNLGFWDLIEMLPMVLIFITAVFIINQVREALNLRRV